VLSNATTMQRRRQVELILAQQLIDGEMA
jgi:hypothetical protein